MYLIVQLLIKRSKYVYLKTIYMGFYGVYEFPRTNFHNDHNMASSDIVYVPKLL
jgi:hypothetical protein